MTKRVCVEIRIKKISAVAISPGVDNSTKTRAPYCRLVKNLLSVKDLRQKFACNREANRYAQRNREVDPGASEATGAMRLPEPGNERGAGGASDPGVRKVPRSIIPPRQETAGHRILDAPPSTSLP